MEEFEFQHQNQLRTSFSAREVSPNSVIFTLESNFSLFSSSSASVDRGSFASDTHESISESSQDLTGNDSQENSSGTESDVRKNNKVEQNNSHISKKADKAKVRKEDSETEVYCENQGLYSGRSSFSSALKECQERRSRSEALLRKSSRRRHASLDLSNHVVGNSPRFGTLKKTSISRRTGTFQSPCTPNYRHTSTGMQKGWSSERLSLPRNANKRHVSSALFPFNTGRTIPSKWEDAERWIFSPVPGDNIARPSFPPLPQRQRKAKSGPLGPPGVAFYSYSPAIPIFEDKNIKNFMHDSPFSAGVVVVNALEKFPPRAEPSMARSASIHGCSEPPSLTISSNDELEAVKDAPTNISRDVSRGDISIHMIPEGSTHSSSKSLTSSALPIVELQPDHSSKPDVNDVVVDKRVTVTKWSKKHKALIKRKKRSGSVNDNKSVKAQSSVSEVSETGNNISSEDARITAWENLQKAKAEAAMRKLEVKLEKRRSSSMNKIMNKLKSAQKKAQEMRKTSVSSDDSRKSTRRFPKAMFLRRPRQISSLSGCFTCHAL